MLSNSDRKEFISPKCQIIESQLRTEEDKIAGSETDALDTTIEQKLW